MTEMVDELRFKNALRCQNGEGVKSCELCPYHIKNDKCDVKLLCYHALKYIEYVEKLCDRLQNLFAEEYGR